MNRRQMMMLSATGAVLGSAAAQQAPRAPAPRSAVAATPDTLLLKDFQPKSMFKIPHTQINKAKYPVIDFHDTGLDTIRPAGPATSFHWTAEPGSVDEMVKTMDAIGVEKAVISGEYVPTPEEFAYCRKFYSKYPNRFDLFCVFDLSAANEPGFAQKAIKALEECHRLGAVGVGESCDKGGGLSTMVGGPDRRPTPLGWNFKGAPHVDDARMDPLLEKCAQLGMPFLVHIHDPIWNYLPADNTDEILPRSFRWKFTAKSDTLGFDALTETLERAAKKHPKTIFVAAHLADLTHDLARLGQMFDQNPNLYVETSARFPHISTIPRFASEFFQKYPDRILYGTDVGLYEAETMRSTFRILETRDEHFYPESGPYMWPLYGLGLPDAILKKVYRDNALNVFKRARNSS